MIAHKTDRHVKRGRRPRAPSKEKQHFIPNCKDTSCQANACHHAQARREVSENEKFGGEP
jgi:hypothetical protein